MNYYYQPGTVPEKASMYSGGLPSSVPGSIPGSLGSLGYPGPQQGALPSGGLPPGSLQAGGIPLSVQSQVPLSQAQSAGIYSTGMQIPSNSHFPSAATYSQSPYASHGMYQSALSYQSPQSSMTGQHSASAYMAAAAEAQAQAQAQAQSQASSPYGSMRLPSTTSGYQPSAAPRGPSSLYGYPGSLNGQATMFHSHPSSMQASMQPGMPPSMHPGMYQGMPGSSLPGLAAPQARSASGPYQSPFVRPLL